MLPGMVAKRFGRPSWIAVWIAVLVVVALVGMVWSVRDDGSMAVSITNDTTTTLPGLEFRNSRGVLERIGPMEPGGWRRIRLHRPSGASVDARFAHASPYQAARAVRRSIPAVSPCIASLSSMGGGGGSVPSNWVIRPVTAPTPPPCPWP